MLVTCDPANVNHAFVTKCSNYPKGKEFTEIFDMFRNSLINTDGEEWKIQRRMTHSLMSNQNFRCYELKTVRDKGGEGAPPSPAWRGRDGQRSGPSGRVPEANLRCLLLVDSRRRSRLPRRRLPGGAVCQGLGRRLGGVIFPAHGSDECLEGDEVAGSG
ncbi:hypothetical protein GW17_00002058 [Ensete ventricosum]|nr:hypothetical protein GW17_00002058 [Ensete ventricosum]